jgi:hypothetical protein
MEAKEEDGWRYGPTLDFARKETPRFQPFEKMAVEPEVDEALDSISNTVVKALAERVDRGDEGDDKDTEEDADAEPGSPEAAPGGMAAKTRAGSAAEAAELYPPDPQAYPTAKKRPETQVP